MKSSEFFTFRGEHLDAFAFIQGVAGNPVVEEVKKTAKEDGFEYDYKYECYFKNKNGSDEHKKAYRVEKNHFIEDLIKWKLIKV